MTVIGRDPIPEGRRPPECPGTCSCRLVCGQAVIDGRVNPAPSATTQGAVDAALRDVLEEAKRRTPQLTGDQLTGDRVAMTIGYVVIDRLRGQ